MVEANTMKELGELKFSELFIGENNPNEDFGLEYDIYINNTSLEIFKKENRIWNSKGFIGELNVNSDWSEDDPESPTYIINKPDFITPIMLDAVEEGLNVKIVDVEILIKELGIIGFDYDESNRTLSVIRENNEKDGSISFPICDGLKEGFISVDTYLEIYKNKQDIIDLQENLSSNYYNKNEIDEKYNSALRYRGQVSTESDLPTEDNKLGDLWDITDTGHNVIWNGSTWDFASGLVDLSDYYTKGEINTELNKKVNKITNNDGGYLYSRLNGEDSAIKYTQSIINSTIPSRTNTGQIKCANAVNTDEAVTLAQLDDRISKKIVTLTEAEYQALTPKDGNTLYIRIQMD